MSRKLVLYIAMSLDGFIAKKDDSLDFLSIVETPNEDYGYAEFTNTIDTVIWGRKTFDKVRSFGPDIPHADKKVYVISKSKVGIDGHVEYSNYVVDLVKKLKSEKGKDIYCDGGAEIVTLLIRSGLFDRIIISVIPHILGDGIRLFKENNLEQRLSLKKSVSYPSGLVQLCYDVVE
jgi:dihydrofolate reductase